MTIEQFKAYTLLKESNPIKSYDLFFFALLVCSTGELLLPAVAKHKR